MGSALCGRPFDLSNPQQLAFLTLIIRVSRNQISGTVPAQWAQMNPPVILALSLFSNADLGGCLPRAWYTRFGEYDTFFGRIPGPPYTQMYANENPTDTKQPEQVSCMPLNGRCNSITSPTLKPKDGVLIGTQITGWCS